MAELGDAGAWCGGLAAGAARRPRKLLRDDEPLVRAWGATDDVPAARLRGAVREAEALLAAVLRSVVTACVPLEHLTAVRTGVAVRLRCGVVVVRPRPDTHEGSLFPCQRIAGIMNRALDAHSRGSRVVRAEELGVFAAGSVAPPWMLAVEVGDQDADHVRQFLIVDEDISSHHVLPFARYPCSSW
jgi:hypothetical protein